MFSVLLFAIRDMLRTTRLKKKLHCQFCGESIPNDSDYCQYCGKEVVKQISREEYDRHVSKSRRPMWLLAFGILLGMAIPLVIWAAQPGCMVHSFLYATCEAPETCSRCGAVRGNPLGHTWIDATCTSPKTCSVCGKTSGSPLAHTWIAATCSTPKKCKVCGYSFGSPSPHHYQKTSPDYPSTCTMCGYMLPMEKPGNGSIVFDYNASGKPRPCKLTIKNQSTDCFVKLKTSTGKDSFGFFVSANQTATITVPEGKYYIFFASAASTDSSWYGRYELFGKQTRCSKDDDLQTFSYESDGEYYTATSLTYTLYKVANGNFDPTDINISEF